MSDMHHNQPASPSPSLLEDVMISTTEKSDESDVAALQKKLQEVEAANIQLQSVNEILHSVLNVSANEVSDLQDKVKELQEENKNQHLMNEVMKASVVDPEKMKSLVKCEMENRLKPMFSPSQIAAILDGHKVNKWSDDDIAEAFTLRSLSSKCY